MWTLGDFVFQVLRCKRRYETEHAWFHWPDPSSYVYCAWRMYRCAGEGALGFLLLGDTKIRLDQSLVRNFGVASAHGVQGDAEREAVARAVAERLALVTPLTGPAAPVVGRGPILSDASWTPLLNDAFILGGVHRGWDFHLVEQGFDQYNVLGKDEFLRRRAAAGPAAPQYAADLARGPEYYKRRWREYLLSHGDLLWRGGIPRVFARELVGLAHFGYAPRFTSTELGFVCVDHGAAASATFDRYLAVLSGVGLPENDRTGVLTAIGQFLFGDPRALHGI